MGISQQIGAASMVKWGVCTSSTRPASPYHGQHIYETDTNLQYIWNGSAWVNNYASSASPALTGVPTAPTATAGTNTTQLATTAFVDTSLGAWTTWSPTVTPSGGVFYILTVNAARYVQIKKTVTCTFDIIIPSVGTATGAMLITLPVTATSAIISGGGCGVWRERAVTGDMGFVCLSSTTQAFLQRYDGGAILNTSRHFVGTFTYEAA